MGSGGALSCHIHPSKEPREDRAIGSSQPLLGKVFVVEGSRCSDGRSGGVGVGVGDNESGSVFSSMGDDEEKYLSSVCVEAETMLLCTLFRREDCGEPP